MPPNPSSGPIATLHSVSLSIPIPLLQAAVGRKLAVRLLVIGAIRGADGHQKVLRLGLRGRRRKRFAALPERIAALAVSTVAQFAPDHKNPPPSPWKPPPPHFQRPLLPAPQLRFSGLTTIQKRLWSITRLWEIAIATTPMAAFEPSVAKVCRFVLGVCAVLAVRRGCNRTAVAELQSTVSGCHSDSPVSDFRKRRRSRELRAVKSNIWFSVPARPSNEPFPILPVCQLSSMNRRIELWSARV